MSQFRRAGPSAFPPGRKRPGSGKDEALKRPPLRPGNPCFRKATEGRGGFQRPAQPQPGRLRPGSLVPDDFGTHPPSSVVCGQWSGLTFQPLSRDSGRLDQIARYTALRGWLFQSLSRDSGRLNPPPHQWQPSGGIKFQSLSRDSGRLNWSPPSWVSQCCRCFNPSVGIRGV